MKSQYLRPGKTGTPEYAAFKTQFDQEVGELLAKSREFENQIYEAAKPAARVYEIVPAP